VKRLVVWVLPLLLVWTGCAYRYQFNTGLPPSGVRVQEWRHIYVWGWVDAAPFDLEQACPSGVSRYGSYINFGNWLPAFLTLGLYAPRTVFAECAATSTAEAGR
jgi:hypothetical protein